MLRNLTKNIVLELAWLLCGWAFSLLVTGFLVGYSRLGTGVDIQLHNTYVVLGPVGSTLPLLLFFASVITCFRALHDGFRSVATNVVLGVLALVWVLVFVAVWLLLQSTRHH